MFSSTKKAAFPGSVTTNRYFLAFVVFLSFSVFHALVSFPIDTGGDAVDRWLRLAEISEEGGFFHFFLGDPPGHHELRWAINFPAYLSVDLLGSQPQSYYAASLIFFCAGVGIFWLSAYEAGGMALACVFLFIFGINDKLVFYAVQLLPTPFGIFYLSLMTLFLVRYSQTRSYLNLFLLSLSMFLSYGAKETNIFFFPGLYVWLLIQRDLRAIGLMSAVLLSLLAVETLVINSFAGGDLLFGRLEALVSGRHLAVMTNAEQHSHYELMDVFKRWDGLSDIQTLTFNALFVLCALGLVFRKRLTSEEGVVLLLGGSFAFFTTFFVVSLDPVRLGQPFGYRYLLVLVPFAALAIAFAVMRGWAQAVPLLERRGVSLPGARIRNLACLAAIPLVFVVVTFQIRSDDINKMPYKRYGLLEANRYFDLLAETLQGGCPIYYLNKSAPHAALKILSASHRDRSWKSDYVIRKVPDEVSERLFDQNFRASFPWWGASRRVIALSPKHLEADAGCPVTFARGGGIVVDATTGVSRLEVQ